MVSLTYSDFDIEGEITEPVCWDSAAALYLFNVKDVGYHISSILGYTLVCGTTPYYTQFLSLNGKRVWHNAPKYADATSYIWFDGSQWIASSRAGCMTKEKWVETDGNEAAPYVGGYTGDTWYSCATLAGSYIARGSLRGTVKDSYSGTPVNVSKGAINGWKKYNKIAAGDEVLVPQTGIYGYYAPCGTQVGAEKVLTAGSSSTWYLGETAVVRI